MSQAGIQVALRFKPLGAKGAPFPVTCERDPAAGEGADANGRPAWTLNIPQAPNHEFRFHHVLNATASQTDVFDTIAKPAALNVLAGYNSTLFAYGQTGSGKTYTITGGDGGFAERGLIPRTLAYLFEQLSSKEGYEYDIRLSYLQVYQEYNLSDLMNNNKIAKSMDDLPRVHTRFLAKNECVLEGLGVHKVNSVDDAMKWVLTGDLNKMFSETAMNKASSRSHCVFTVYFRGKPADSDTWKRAKMHIVDLAGSERLKKTKSEGQVLEETKFINSSLFHLQQVIHALASKDPVIPYRDSQLTKVLADSLGGNCKTVMMANISSEEGEFDETINTIKFAQRVACISTTVKVNEELDAKIVIQQLNQRVADMQAQLELAGQDEEGPLTEDDIQHCKEIMDTYMDCPTDSDDALKTLRGSVKRTVCCFALARNMVRRLRQRLEGHDGDSEWGGSETLTSEKDTGDERNAVYDWWQKNKSKSLGRRKSLPSRRNVTPPRKLPIETQSETLSPRPREDINTRGSVCSEPGPSDVLPMSPPPPKPREPGWVRGRSSTEATASRNGPVSSGSGGSIGPTRVPTPHSREEFNKLEDTIKGWETRFRTKERVWRDAQKHVEELQRRLQRLIEEKESEVGVLLSRIHKLEKRSTKWKKRAKDSVPGGGKGVAWGGTTVAPTVQQQSQQAAATLRFEPKQPEVPKTMTAEDERDHYTRLQERMMLRQQQKMYEKAAEVAAVPPQPAGGGVLRAGPQGPAPMSGASPPPQPAWGSTDGGFPPAVRPPNHHHPMSPDGTRPYSSHRMQQLHQQQLYSSYRSGAATSPNALSHNSTHSPTATAAAPPPESGQRQQVSLIAAAQQLHDLQAKYDLNHVHTAAAADGCTVLDNKEKTRRWFRESSHQFAQIKQMRQQIQECKMKAKAQGEALQTHQNGLRDAKREYETLARSASSEMDESQRYGVTTQLGVLQQSIAYHTQMMEESRVQVVQLRQDVQQRQMYFEKVDTAVQIDFEAWWGIAAAIADMEQ